MNNQSDTPHPRHSPESEALLFSGRAPGVSDELHEAFMRSVEDFENAPLTTLSRLLIKDGIQLPTPKSFTEETVHDKLWEVIHAMAHHRNFLYSTNHLSDLELYQYLWEESLNNPFQAIPPEMTDSAWNIDLTGDGSEESNEIWLRYHADEAERQDWITQFPETPLPARAAPLHDRDRLLPQR